MDSSIIQSLVNAIAQRKSVRTFEPWLLSAAMVDELRRFTEEANMPFEHQTRFLFFQAEPGQKLYNNGLNPADNMAIMAQTDLLSISKAGFLGEVIMLYAVSKGLSTCWFGHYKLSELGRYIPGIDSPEQAKASTLGYGYGKGVDVGERAICCMPFGHRDTQTKRFVDFVASKNGAHRKPLEQLLEHPEKAGALSEPVRRALELARLAPSAANSQFWRFGVSDDGKTITVAKPVGYRHFKWEHPDVDIGMCAAHIWLGLIDQGLEPKVTARLDQDRVLWSFTI